MPTESSDNIFPLCGMAKGFKIDNALACALASQATYLAPELIPGIVIDKWGFADYRRINGKHIQGFVAASEKATLVAFRGSEAHVSNWQDNLDAGFVPGPFTEGDRLHRDLHRDSFRSSLKSSRVSIPLNVQNPHCSLPDTALVQHWRH